MTPACRSSSSTLGASRAAASAVCSHSCRSPFTPMPWTSGVTVMPTSHPLATIGRLWRGSRCLPGRSGLGPCVLVGSSSGGYVAQRFAIDEPSRTLGLVLVGAPRSLRGRPPFADEVDRLTDPIDRDWVRSSLEWFELHHPVPSQYVAERIDDGVRMPAHVWKQALAGLSEAPVPTETGTILRRRSSSGAAATTCYRLAMGPSSRLRFPNRAS